MSGPDLIGLDKLKLFYLRFFFVDYPICDTKMIFFGNFDLQMVQPSPELYTVARLGVKSPARKAWS